MEILQNSFRGVIQGMEARARPVLCLDDLAGQNRLRAILPNINIAPACERGLGSIPRLLGRPEVAGGSLDRGGLLPTRGRCRRVTDIRHRVAFQGWKISGLKKIGGLKENRKKIAGAGQERANRSTDFPCRLPLRDPARSRAPPPLRARGPRVLPSETVEDPGASRACNPSPGVAIGQSRSR
jgi:hypothetical protein